MAESRKGATAEIPRNRRTTLEQAAELPGATVNQFLLVATIQAALAYEG